MKKLVVFYSLEGNTRLMAKEIADEIGADLMGLKPKKYGRINPPGREWARQITAI